MHPQERTALCHVFVFRFSLVSARFSKGLATTSATGTHPHQHTVKVSSAAVLAGQKMTLEMAGYLMITQGRQRRPRRLLTRGSSRAAVALVLLRSRSPSRPLRPGSCTIVGFAVAVRLQDPKLLLPSWQMAASQPVTPQHHSRTWSARLLLIVDQKPPGGRGCQSRFRIQNTFCTSAPRPGGRDCGGNQRKGWYRLAAFTSVSPSRGRPLRRGCAEMWGDSLLYADDVRFTVRFSVMNCADVRGANAVGGDQEYS